MSDAEQRQGQNVEILRRQFLSRKEIEIRVSTCYIKS